MLPDNQPEIIDATKNPGRIEDTTDAPREAQRSRGGQPGNLNALRHGFRDLCAPEVPESQVDSGDREGYTSKLARKPGAQPGNLNALRHGFYARNLGNFSPREYPEAELRNLLGEAAMIKDYMYFLYNHNLGSTNSAILAETLRALSLGGMALTRLLLIHNRVRVYVSPSTESGLSDILDSLDSATARANKRFPETDDEDDEDDEDED